MSEIFILITLITTIIYSPVYFPLECNFFSRISSFKNYLLNQFLCETSKSEHLINILQQDYFLKNYFLYQKNEIKGVVHMYIVSAYNKTFFQILSNNTVVNINEINVLLHQYPALNNLKIGQVIAFITVKGYGLRSLLWQISDKESRIYNRVSCSDHFLENSITKFNRFDKKGCYFTVMGKLHDNFINTARSLGIDIKNIQRIIDALQWQLNFRKLRIGDHFSILMIYSKYVNNFNDINTDCNDQIVIAVRLRNFSKDYYAFRADNGRFYNQEAISMMHNFMKFPTIKPFRISSNFNLNRLNPITGRISPHLGVDFAVPIGTPVFSIGDGEVIISKYGAISGNYIAIRHGSYCISRYMHLKRLLVKPGQVVKKGENIALSGNTGRSTGPHLHFEVWVNHKPVNPLTATFLHIERLSGFDRINYINKINTILPYLNIKQ